MNFLNDKRKLQVANSMAAAVRIEFHFIPGYPFIQLYFPVYARIKKEAGKLDFNP